MFSHCLSLFYIGAKGALVNDWQWQEVAQPLDIVYLGKNILLSIIITKYMMIFHYVKMFFLFFLYCF